jgi:HlyD family secretion protein
MTTETMAPPPSAPAAPTAPAPPRPRGAARPPRARRRRRVAWVLAALLAAAAAVWALRPSPLEVETAVVDRGPLRETVDEDGATRVRDRFAVAAPVGGRLVRIDLEEGDAVAAGEVVARIAAPPLDPRTAGEGAGRLAAARAGVRQAEARVAQAAAAHAQALRESERARVLADAGALSRQEREEAELQAATRAREVDAARALAAAAAAEATAAEGALRDAAPEGGVRGPVVEVRAPVAGRVLRVAERSGRTVAAGTPLVELGDARALEVVVDVLSADAVRIAPGMRVEIGEWGGEGILPARVRTVSPAAFTRVSALGVEEQRVNVVIDLEAAPAALGDGYRVEARIVTWESAAAPRVPAGALFRSGDGWTVFVVDGGRARLRAVETGRRGEGWVEVVSGIAAGEAVVMYPGDRVEAGMRVRGG